MKQANLGLDLTTKRTRKREFLDEMNRVVPWGELVALVSPLFFQVVTDKVLVHRGYTTLDVLVVGLITVSLFESVLGALRTKREAQRAAAWKRWSFAGEGRGRKGARRSNRGAGSSRSHGDRACRRGTDLRR